MLSFMLRTWHGHELAKLQEPKQSLALFWLCCITLDICVPGMSSYSNVQAKAVVGLCGRNHEAA